MCVANLGDVSSDNFDDNLGDNFNDQLGDNVADNLGNKLGEKLGAQPMYLRRPCGRPSGPPFWRQPTRPPTMHIASKALLTSDEEEVAPSLYNENALAKKPTRIC